MAGGLRLAVGLLTVIPVQPPATIGRPQARAAMLWAPIAILPVAVMAAGVGWVAHWLQMPAILAGLLVVAVLALGTRAMHADGLADTVDALGSGHGRDRALEVMKSGDIGPMGTLALIVVVAAQSAAAGALVERPWGWLLVAAMLVTSRAALLFGTLTGIPAARDKGLGALVAGSVPIALSVLWWLGLGALVTWLAMLAGLAYWIPICAVMAAAIVVAWLVNVAVRRFGGITGDVLGASVELAATTLLVVGTVAAPV